MASPRLHGSITVSPEITNFRGVDGEAGAGEAGKAGQGLSRAELRARSVAHRRILQYRNLGPRCRGQLCPSGMVSHFSMGSMSVTASFSFIIISITAREL